MAGNQNRNSTDHYNTEREADAVWAFKSLLVVLGLVPFLHWLLVTEYSLLRQAAIPGMQSIGIAQ